MAHFDIAHEVGSREFEKPLRRLGLPTRIRALDCGDFAFYGNGPDGAVRVGIERKTIGEMVGYQSRGRYVQRQLPRMLRRYGAFSFLVVEGLTRVAPGDGSLQCGKDIKQGSLTVWMEAGWGRERNTYEVYKKRELSLRLITAIHVMPTANATETASLLHALYGWFQKPWSAHRSVLKVDTDIVMRGAPALILDERTMRRETFAKWPHISWERSARVSKHFPSIVAAATATEDEWMMALGVKQGRKMAKAIVDFLHGRGEERTAKGA